MVPEEKRSKDLRWYYRNKDKVSKKKQEQYWSNPDKYRELNRENYKRNKERILGYKKRWAILYPEKVKEAAKKSRLKRKDIEADYNLKRNFGISLVEFTRILSDQGNVCAICGKMETEGRRMSVDHCHQTGMIRGILCSRCNVSIGRFNDDPFLLLKAVNYLSKWQKQVQLKEA